MVLIADCSLLKSVCCAVSPKHHQRGDHLSACVFAAPLLVAGVRFSVSAQEPAGGWPVLCVQVSDFRLGACFGWRTVAQCNQLDANSHRAPVEVSSTEQSCMQTGVLADYVVACLWLDMAACNSQY